MDPSILSLIVTQSITFLLLVISETMSLTNTPYNGLVQALLGALQNYQRQPQIEPVQ